MAQTAYPTKTQRSLFRTLVESPWWVSVLVAALMYPVGALLAQLLPGAHTQLMGTAAAAPFAGIALYTAYLRIRRGAPVDAPRLLNALRSASPEEVRAMLVEAYERAQYEIADGASGDLELNRNGYLTLLRFRRWRAQSTGPAAIDELQAAMRARKADRGIYVTAGAVSESARKRASEREMTLIDGPALAQLVGRTRSARATVRRVEAEAAKS